MLLSLPGMPSSPFLSHKHLLIYQDSNRIISSLQPPMNFLGRVDHSLFCPSLSLKNLREAEAGGGINCIGSRHTYQGV